MTNRVDESRFFQACFYLMEKNMFIKFTFLCKHFFCRVEKRRNLFYLVDIVNFA